MFLRTSNGYLININTIKSIYVTVPADNEGNFCRVIARTEDGEVALYRDIESQYCQQYMEELAKKIAITVSFKEET